MVNSNLKKPGTLVKFRGRRCVVQPSTDSELILLKPLGGSDEEMMAVFEPVLGPNDKIESDQFDKPSVEDLDSFITAKMLYDAARLSFRQVSGPFRCMGKLSFRPRSYQLVPLIMALKQPVTRLLIADDVGVGKTVEALLILRELLERGAIKTFAILCPPHLCEQWQKELADKLDYKKGKMNKYKFISEYCGEYKILFNVSPNVFYPKPKVNSKVIKFELTKQNIDKKATIIDIIMDKKFERDGKLDEINISLDSIFPKLEGDKVTFIGSTFMKYGEQEPYMNHCIALNTCSKLSGENSILESYQTEKEVLLSWQKLIQKS